MTLPGDSVDRLLADWGRARPDLDVSPVGVVSRLAKVRALIDHELEALFAEHGIGGPDFAVLVTLARVGEPGGVPQRRLMDELDLTSGTVSVRIDRLADRGLVQRLADESDRRSARIVLTERGRELFERIVPAHLENERRLLSALDDDERATLAALLRKLLIEFEGRREGPAPRLGLTLAPAHVTIAMREAVGLPGRPGLLVRAVEDDGPAARAGLAVGDVIVGAGRREVRSLAGLGAALGEVDRGGRVRLRVVRGVEEREVVIEPERARGPRR